MDPMTLLVELLRSLLLVAGGALWATAVTPRGRDPRQRWRVRLASAALACMVAGSALFGTDPLGAVTLALGLVALIVSADDPGLEVLFT